jgi:hypothetical protein
MIKWQFVLSFSLFTEGVVKLAEARGEISFSCLHFSGLEIRKIAQSKKKKQ